MLPKSNKGTEARAGIHDDQQSLQLLGNDEELSTIKNDISADAVILSLQKRLRKIYVLLAVLTMVVFLLIWINFREIEISSMTTSSGVAMFKHQELQLLNSNGVERTFMTDERIKELLGGIQHSSYEVGLMPANGAGVFLENVSTAAVHGSEGSVKNDTNIRTFGLTVFHQIHCLDFLRYYFLENISNEVHIPHCLEYLYDSIICAADTTLEWVDDKGVADGIGVQHKCNNFGNVLAWAKANGDKYNYLIEARRPN